MVAAGPNRTVLLRSDGRAVYCGEPPAHGAAPKRWSGSCLWVQQGQCEIPPLDAGQFYTQVSAGHNHTVVLRSDGVAVACGHNLYEQCNIPPLEHGMTYTQIAAGGHHTVLLRSDGHAVACGLSSNGLCNIPPLVDERSTSYI